ncbi:MAG: hypothetical protein KDB02_08885 [Acidimicrobiales bacterium]|nr:hypothetical protein [Acidimicrobiales bacterium]
MTRPAVARRFLDRTRDEAGETLIETVMSLLLIATVVMAVIFSLFTVMRSTRAHRKIVRSGNESVAVAEQLHQVPYLPCGGSVTPLDGYQNDVELNVPGFEADIIDVRFLKDGNASLPPGGDSFQTTCPTTDQGVQELTVVLHPTTDTGVAQRLAFYKRANECPQQNQQFEGQLC